MASVKRILAPGTATTQRGILIIPLIIAGPLTISASRQAHTLSSPEPNSHSPLLPSTLPVMASVQRMRAPSTITTQRAHFSLFPSTRWAHQRLGQLQPPSKLRVQSSSCTKFRNYEVSDSETSFQKLCASLVVSRVHFFRESLIQQRLVTPGKKEFSNYSIIEKVITTKFRSYEVSFQKLRSLQTS